jgi:GNAT superfamily N-acetyltransferase
MVVIETLLEGRSVYGIVAETPSRIVGACFLDESDEVHGLGPIVVDPEFQGVGIGRRLMKAVLNHSGRSSPVRLTQDAFNITSISLYASLGFRVRETLMLVKGRPAFVQSGFVVRQMKRKDLDDCIALCKKVLGISRANALRGAFESLSPMVATRNGRVVAYVTTLANWEHSQGVAENDLDMQALIAGAANDFSSQISFLAPVRRSDFFHWCVMQDFTLIKPLTLMTLGRYNEPAGCYIPSVLY